MKKPRLLVAVDSYLPRWDGIARSLSELLPHMVKDYEIRLIIPDYPGERPTIEGVTYIPLPLIPFVHSSDLRFPIVFPWVVRKQIQWADLLWTHTAVSIGGACIREAHKRDVPIVSMIHSVEWVIYGKASLIGQRFAEWLWLRIARSRYSRARLLITPGATTKKELLESDFKKTIEVTPLGVSLEQFSPLSQGSLKAHRMALGLPVDRPIIGYVGRFGPEKNLETLIQAHAKIEEETGAHLILVGGEPHDLGGGTRGTHLTIVSPTMEPERYYQAMDIYVLPSLTESFALGILEAMACGVPPVSTPVGAMPTFIVPDKNGILFPTQNVDALAEFLRELIADAPKRESMGAEARKTVEDGYTWEQAATRISAKLKEFAVSPAGEASR